MPTSRRWHHGSLYGDGPRRALDREQRARYRYLLTAHRRSRHLTPYAELVGAAVLKRLSAEGRCDPSHDTIAEDVGCCARTVRRALDRLKTLGLLMWQQRIVRSGWRVAQTSNAYLLTLCSNPAVSTGGQSGRGTGKRESISLQQPVIEVTAEKRKAARDGLAATAAARMQALGL